jgi:ABC-type multidrug transport system fused ATPase/permease subunit
MLRLQSAAITMRSASGQAAPTFALAEELVLCTSGQNFDSSASWLSAPPDVTEKIRTGHAGFDPSLNVTCLCLAYPGSLSQALTNISFELASGSSLALVGSTGAGKSTLADVILGVLQPDRGSVLIGGLSPTEAIAQWPGALAYVPQDVAMVNGTVRENVALGLAKVTIEDELVWEALERAHLAEFLINCRDGLNTVIGEHGMKLSGGQRQRLGVARALYTKPRFLVLDEATSALDAETEQGISETLQELEGTVTTVTIAHRLATIRHCDLVIFMESGAIAASGTFDQVRQRAKQFDHQAHLLGL